jgi:polyisoprenoid-binding protein YceI
MSIEHWEIDNSHSGINFTVRHLLISKARGRFTRWSGTVQVPDGDWGRATVDVVIDASSIDTGIPKRDTDLRSAHFLDVERYPVITFRTLYVTARRADAFQIVGELTMKGRVDEVILETERSGVTLDASGYERTRFSARTAIRRRDFGASGNVVWDRYGIMIGERIDIAIEVEAVRQPAAATSFRSDIHDLTVSRG